MKNHLSSKVIKSERNILHASFSQSFSQSSFVISQKHQESAAARANQLSADGSVFHSDVIPFVDLTGRHAFGALLFVLPMSVHQSSKFSEISFFQSMANFYSEILGKVKILDHVIRRRTYGAGGGFCRLILLLK